MTLLKEALEDCPPPVNARVEGARVGVVNDRFLVKLGVTGVGPLYPTLLLGSSEVNHLQEKGLGLVCITLVVMRDKRGGN